MIEPKPNIDRQREFVARRRREGWRRMQVWVHPGDWDRVNKLVQRLTQRRVKK